LQTGGDVCMHFKVLVLHHHPHLHTCAYVSIRQHTSSITTRACTHIFIWCYPMLYFSFTKCYDVLYFS
jgi:hypothetical protein